MTGRHQSIPLSAIAVHPTLQNRNTTASMRNSRQRAEERLEHVGTLAQNISAEGQKVPLDLIEMTDQEAHKTRRQYWQVGGHHRLEALHVLKRTEAFVTILEGRGLPDARRHSYQQNLEITKPLEPAQRLANTWRALNDIHYDQYRLMTAKALAVWARLTDRTVQRMWEVRRRWAAREQGIDYEVKRAKARESGQRGIRAFNDALDGYCDQHLKTLYTCDYGMLKSELGRGTDAATIEERQLIDRTVVYIMQALNACGLNTAAPMRSALQKADNILTSSKSYYDACDKADIHYLSSSEANLERYNRRLEIANSVDPIEDDTDF